MADSYLGIQAWKFCRVCRPIIQDRKLGSPLGVALCTACLLMVDRGSAKEGDERPVEWTIDHEAWRLEAFEDGPYRLTKKAIADVSEETGSLVVTEEDLADLVKVLAARGALED